MEPEGRPNILVVDDVDYNIAYIEGIIKHLEVNIIKAVSGKEALMKIIDKKLALALIDVYMPEMDGIELATIIQGDKTRDIVPIIFVTAYNHDELSLEKCYDSGIIDFILKPFRKNILLSKIKIFLELDRQKQIILDSGNMYRLLLNASPEGIIIMDIEGRIKEISNITSEIFGITEKQEFIGKSILDLFPNDEHERIQEVIKKTLNDGLAQNEEFILRRANQTEFMSEISLTLIRGNDGIPSALMAIMRDISQRKKMEQQLIHTERMAGLGEMAAGIAHEINQPLNIMSLSFENILYDLNMKKTIDEVSLRDRSDKIFESIFRIGKIIDHIRVFSREQQDYILTLFDVNESIINAQSMVAEQFGLKNIELVNILNKKSSKVVGNTYKFEQVILNLLLNAKDTLQEKEAISNQEFHKIIEIKTLEDEHNIFVEIVDNGVGIKPDELHKIMLPFYSTKEPGKGTGLGLSISFGIIKEMNGNIEVTSDFSSGTKMRIILPIEHAIP
jgi:PAS domain S-box-containing protein